MPALNARDFKVSYAATAMPIRYIVERGQWSEAAAIVPPTEAPPHVVAIAVWAQGIGFARSGHAAEAHTAVDRLQQIQQQLRAAGNDYWAGQTAILKGELSAWVMQAQQKPDVAVIMMQTSANTEDGIEKLPVTPGPIIPAREQLGSLLLEQNQPSLALREFQTSLKNSPGRRGALEGAAEAAKLPDAK
jgi:hypothetical protein